MSESVDDDDDDDGDDHDDDVLATCGECVWVTWNEHKLKLANKRNGIPTIQRST